MSSFLIVGFLLAVTGSLTLAVEYPLEDGDDLDEAGRALKELFGGYDSHKESLVYERSFKESFAWRDCGGSVAVVHLKSFSISPLPLRLPGDVIVALNATVDSDIDPPISVDMDIRKKVALSWINICSYVPGGCKRQNICSTQRGHSAAAAAAAEEEDVDASPFCQMKKGDFSLPPTSFSITEKAPSGWYRIRARFLKDSKLIGCIYIQLNIG